MDELQLHDQGDWVGLGWTLDTGAFILRNPATNTFKLVYGGASYDLVLVDSTQSIYHTKDETFLKLTYVTSGDYWTLQTKDGTAHRLGFTANSKATTLVGATPTTYKYLLDQVTTVSGVGVQYSYVKQTATSGGQSYDQAVYLDTITYAYSNSTLLGPGREVRFLRQPRTDWTDTSATTTLSFFENQRLDAIEVRIAGNLVTRYSFGFDYSIVRDPGYTWGGGAQGDLTLKSVTIYGSDGVSTMPSLSFTYNPAGRLDTVGNGIGGSASFTYQAFDAGTTSTLYSAQIVSPTGVCQDWGGSNTPTPCPGGSFLLGYVSKFNFPGTIPLYSIDAVVGLDYFPGTQVPHYVCDWIVWPDTSPTHCGTPSLLGYIFTNSLQGGMVPVYLVWTGGYLHTYYNDVCERGVGTAPNTTSNCYTPQLGYMYAAPRQRYRVITRTLNDGAGRSANTSFSYTGPAINGDGTEFRGHAMVRVVDPSGAYNDTWFKQDDVFKGRPYQAESRDSTGALFLRIVNTWVSSTPYAGVNLVTSTRTDTYEYDGEATYRQTARSFEYDAYANPTRAYDLGDVAVIGDERDEHTDWLVDQTNWLHRPSHTAIYDATNTLVRERWISYDNLAWGSLGIRGLVTQEEDRLAGPAGTAGNAVVTHTYNDYGMRTSTTDPRGCSITTVYETAATSPNYQTFPTSMSTCLGHTTLFQYDARWGVKASETDPNSQTKAFSYDVFGRLTRVTGPLDTASQYGTVSYEYPGLGNPLLQRIRTVQTLQHGTANVRWSEQYFDGLGRVYQTTALGPSGQVIVTDVRFDTRGLVQGKSAPHLSTETTLWTQFTYDAVARQTRVDYPDGTFATTGYSPGVATLTDQRGNVKRKFTDAYGRLAQVEEHNGTNTYLTTYIYDGMGALTQLKDHLGNLTQITYDLLGRKKTMQDPNTGAWSYSYDVGGNLLSQTDAKLQTLNFTYDLQGRPQTKKYPSAAMIQWTYDDPTVAYSKGRLTQVSDPVAVTKFTYDQVGHVTQTTRVLGGTTYTMTQTYDAIDHVLTRTFPDQETVTYNYDAGWLANVPGYVTSITYNARGERTQMQYANGTTSSWTYDPQNFRTTSHSTTGPGGITLQNLSYGYDPGGNITQITDILYTGSRTFGYDALNRLTSANGTFGAPVGGVPALASETYSYDAIGNILTKAGAAYSYTDPLHPSAVTARSDGPAYTYDANGNMSTVTGPTGRTMTWDEDNRLTAAVATGGNVTFDYDYRGERVRKVTGAGATLYPFADYEIGANGVIITRLGFASKKSTGQTFFYHNDHLGGVNVITDATGAKVQLIEYDPWGNVSRAEGTAEPSLRFTGQYLDPETGLLY